MCYKLSACAGFLSKSLYRMAVSYGAAMRRSTLVIVVVCLAAILLGCIEQDGEMVKPAEIELVLSDYPELFEKDVIIVIGNNASGMEIEGADAIVENLFNLTGNMPVIKTDDEITQDELAGHNLILVGGADSNEVLRAVYNMTDAMRVTDEYPGAGKGVLEILRSPWDPEKAMLLVAGSDDTGVDIMEQISTQTKKIHLKRVYGPYAGYKPPELPLGMEGLPDPSAVYCINLGYKYKIRTLSDGSQIGYCVFEDFIFGRKECPAWDFYNGLCGEEYTYCSKTGGVLIKINEAACVLPSGKICYEWDYSQGACR